MLADMPVIDNETRKAAALFGAMGGRARSDRKTKAARRNARKGGWPKGKKRGKRKSPAIAASDKP